MKLNTLAPAVFCGTPAPAPTAGASTAAAPADYTVLYYLNGDNDLREHVTMNLVRLDQAKAGPSTNAVAALFRGDWVWNRKNLGRKLEEMLSPKPPPAVQTDWRGRKVFVVGHRDGHDYTHEVAAPGRDVPSDPKSLKEFVAWGMQAFPAKHTVLVVSGHGAGHRGILCDRYGNRMDIPHLAGALEGAQKQAGGKIEAILLEGCCMGQVEVAYQLRHSADLLLVSPEPLTNTAPHNRLLDLLAAAPGIAPRDIVERVAGSDAIKDNATSITAVDLTKMDAVLEAARALGPHLINTATPQSVLRGLHDQARVYGPDLKSREMVDMGNLVGTLISDPQINDVALQAGAKQLQSALQSAIIAHRDDDDPSRTGLSIYVPNGKPDKTYLQMEFPQTSGWGAYLTHPRRKH